MATFEKYKKDAEIIYKKFETSFNSIGIKMQNDNDITSYEMGAIISALTVGIASLGLYQLLRMSPGHETKAIIDFFSKIENQQKEMDE